ncbi:MAG: hypothetical protein ACK2UH_17920 [Candidatus Promineifilaceae bacterium]
MKRIRPIFWLIIVLVLTAMACNFVTGTDEPTATPEAEPTLVQEEIASPTDTPLPLPTDTPEPLPTEPQPTEAPPVEAPPTAVPEELPVASLELDETAYTHYLGFFDAYPPVGWIMEEGDGGATFTAPDETGYIEVEVNNTGATLDGESFTRFVDAREINYFGQYDGYEIVDYQIDPEFGRARVAKTLVMDGFPQDVFTYYDQYGPAIFVYDFWADSDVAEAYTPAFEEFFNTSPVYSTAVEESAEVYYWIYTFYGPDDLFSIEVPIPWTYEFEEEEDVIIDTFSSPDEHAFIQNITYDDGTEISKSDAGAFALGLLKEIYADDIQISNDQVQPDGSERLTWSSPSGEYSGISFLETRGTTFLLFSVLWDNAYEDYYYDTLNYTIGTYVVP